MFAVAFARTPTMMFAVFCSIHSQAAHFPLLIHDFGRSSACLFFTEVRTLKFPRPSVSNQFMRLHIVAHPDSTG
jgi:hypothetical protein